MHERFCSKGEMNMTTLMKANSQWSNRAPDERFDSIEAMHAQALLYQAQAKEFSIKSPRVLAKAIDVSDGEIVLNNKNATRQARLTNWSFGQLCKEAEAPPSYLSRLPAPLAKECLQTGLMNAPDDECKIMFRENGGVQLRALNSPRYSRIWNADITKRLVDLKSRGTWQEAPAAYDGSRGQYLGDRDMFAFFVDNNRRIFERAPGGGLSRGFFAWNSEVGYASFGVMMFMYQHICGNHIVWEASNISEIRVRHVGDANSRGFQNLMVQVRKYAEGSATEDEARIEAAHTYKLGTTQDEVLARLFGLNLAPKKTMEAAYDVACKHEDWYGDPRSAWAVSSGITQIARDLPNADARVALDRVGAKVLELAWKR